MSAASPGGARAHRCIRYAIRRMWHAAEVERDLAGSPWSAAVSRRRFAGTGLLLLVSAAAACSRRDEAPASEDRLTADRRPIDLGRLDQRHRFPRSAACFLGQDVLPAAEALARYDVVVIDSEWHGRLGAEYFDRLRVLNPDVCLLAYVNLVDRPLTLGSPGQWAGRYALWQFQSPESSTFPGEWMATTAAGQPVSEWPDTWMTNLTDAAPRIGGLTYAEYAADWVVNRVWRTGVWNGVFLDVWGDRIWSADRDAWDYRLVGADSPEGEIYGPGSPWERGIDTAERRMRAGMPDAVLVANGDRTLRNRQLNGRVWESFLDQTTNPARGADLRTYMDECASPAVRQPVCSMTIDSRGAPKGSAEDFRRARYFLTGTLMQNGYWAPAADNDYDELGYYDELDGAGIGRGYLGMPLFVEPDFERLRAPFADGIGVVSPDVYRRDFDHGIVLHNSGASVRTVDFERPMRLLRGTQAPAVNTGQVVDSVVLGPHDGRVLLRSL